MDWKYLECTIVEMGLGEKFVDWFRLLYKNPRSKVRVNGHCMIIIIASKSYDFERNSWVLLSKLNENCNTGT